MRKKSNVIYLLHFDRPYKHAMHYIGFTSNLRKRIEAHRSGLGARLLAVIKSAGIGFTVARTWNNATRTRERQIKNVGHAKRYCPICKELK